MLLFTSLLAFKLELLGFLKVCYIAGTRFQDTRNKSEEEDVVAEHEDKAYSPGHHFCLDYGHSSFNMSWLQLSLIDGHLL